MPRDHIFISYSHADLEWRKRLERHLKPFPFIQEHQIKLWSDEQIGAGENWQEDIERALSEAKVAVLLVTVDFLASNWIVEHELLPALAAVEKRGLTLTWIAVSASSFDVTGLGPRQALNSPNKPLNSLSPADQEKELVEIAHKIAAAARSSEEDRASTGQRITERAPGRSPPKRADFSYLLYGCAGGTIAGIYIGLAYYVSQRQLNFLLLLLLVVFSVAIGALSSASIHYFVWRFRERRNNAPRPIGLLYDLVAGGLGGAITSVGASLLAAITFGQLDAPPISPAHLLLGVGLGTVLIIMSVLKSEGAGAWLSLTSSFCAAVVVFSLLIALILIPSFDNALREYFPVSDPIIMLVRAISVGFAAGILIGLQIAFSRLIRDLFVTAGQPGG